MKLELKDRPAGERNYPAAPSGGIAINGKYLSATMTGVHRVAGALVLEMYRHRDELTVLFGTGPHLVGPRNAATQDLPADLSRDCHSVFVGQPWEQIELPMRVRGGLLLSLCNLAPVASPAAITMIHDAQVFISPESYSPAFVHFYRTIQPILGHRALRILTVSDYSARQLVHYGVAPAERIRVIHNGVDHVREAAPDPTVLAQLGLAGERYVLALGSLQAHKNLATLLAAFAAPGLGDIRLVLFGGVSRADLVAAGFAMNDRIVCAGRVSDGALAALIQHALCYASPSRTEGFGLPPLEAMLQGCPAVVSTAGALPEVCGAAALYAAPDDPGAWVSAIRALADDPALRARHTALGRAHAAGFTWRRAGERLMDVLRDVALERRAAARR